MESLEQRVVLTVNFTDLLDYQHDAPTLPGDVASYTLPNDIVADSTPTTDAPIISEWTRSAGPNESIAVTGYNFTATTTFWVYGPGFSAPVEATLQTLDGTDRATVTLPDEITTPSSESLDPNSMYVMWANNGTTVDTNHFSAPVAINQTDTWWVGSDRLNAGDTLAIYGRNLTSLPGDWVKDGNDWEIGGIPQASAPAYVVLETADHEYINATIVDANPYKIDVELPPELEAGTYTAWVHNGLGGIYGWGTPLEFTIVNDPWAGGPTTTISAGDTAGLISAIEGADDYETIYVSAGTYLFDAPTSTTHPSAAVTISGKVRLIGSGAETTTFHLERSSNASYDYSYFFKIGSDTVIQGIAFESDPEVGDDVLNKNSDEGYLNGVSIALLQVEDASNVLLDRISIDSKDVQGLQIVRSDHVTFINSTSISNSNHISDSHQVFFDNDTFILTNRAESAVDVQTSYQFAITNSTIESYDPSQATMKDSGLRFFWSRSGTQDQYIANNLTQNIGLSDNDTGDHNKGEQISWEAALPIYSGSASNVIDDTSELTDDANWLSFTDANAMIYDKLTSPQSGVAGWRYTVRIIDGTGVGQFRYIDMSSVTFESGVLRFRLLGNDWRVRPDSNSRLLITPIADHAVVYQNKLKGLINRVIDTDYNASAGIQLFSSSQNNIIDGNTISDLRNGISIWGIETSGEGGDDKLETSWVNDPFQKLGYVEASMFNLIQNNTITDYRNGIVINEAPLSLKGDQSTLRKLSAVLGNVIRSNHLEGVEDTIRAANADRSSGIAVFFRQSPDGVPYDGRIDASIIEANDVINTPYGLDLNITQYVGNIASTLTGPYISSLLVRKNSFSGRLVSSDHGLIPEHGSFGARIGSGESVTFDSTPDGANEFCHYDKDFADDGDDQTAAGPISALIAGGLVDAVGGGTKHSFTFYVDDIFSTSSVYDVSVDFDGNGSFETTGFTTDGVVTLDSGSLTVSDNINYKVEDRRTPKYTLASSFQIRSTESNLYVFGSNRADDISLATVGDQATVTLEQIGGHIWHNELVITLSDSLIDHKAFILGLAGSDVIDASDVTSGADFELILSGGIFSDTVIGGEGNDIVVGDGYAIGSGALGDGIADDDEPAAPGDAGDLLKGGDGNDSLYGGGGQNTLVGGAGDDFLEIGEERDSNYYSYFDGDVGDDTIGGDSDPNGDYSYLDLSGLSTGVTIDLTGAGSGASKVLTLGTSMSVEVGAFTGSTRLYIQNVIGTSAADTITGSDRANNIAGRGGDDTIVGGGGNDFIVGDTGNDSLNGGDDDDHIYGGIGNDKLIGGTYDDYLSGGVGNDTYIYAGNNLGADKIDENVNGGSDTVDFSGYTPIETGITFSLVYQGESRKVDGNSDTTAIELIRVPGVENIIGSSGHDILEGNESANVIEGGGGNDSLFGNKGDDTYVYNGISLGSDSIYESVDPGFGRDTLDFSGFTAPGGTTINLSTTTPQVIDSASTPSTSILVVFNTAGVTGIENVVGSAFNDSITGNTLDNVLDGGAGIDSISGGSGNDTIIGGAGNDSLDGGSGDDSYLFSGTSLGADTIADASGIDTLNFTGFGSDVSIDLSDTSAHTVSADLTLTLPNSIENVIGSSNNDTITGNALSNLLQGAGGNDSISAYAGSGTLDTLEGGAGNDTYYSTESGTTFRFSGLALGTDTVNDFNSGAVVDFSNFGRDISFDLTNSSPQSMGTDLTVSFFSRTNIKTVIGSNFGDTITGDSNANSLIGGGGNDTITGGSGNDTILGGGDDDSLTGGAGNDSLDGGSGNDSYLFSGTSLGADTIADASGIDTLNFTGFGSDASVDLSDTSAHTVSSDLTLTLPSTIENVIGSSNNDTITGNALSNLLQGAGGNDSISAYAGSGTLDTLEGGAGNDTYYSTESGTTFRFSGLALGTDTVNDFNSGAVVDFSNFGRDISFDLTNSSPQSMGTDLTVSFFSRTNIKTVIGSNFGDTITGDSNANSLIGGGGNDTITGGNGNDTINGGTGDDSLDGGSGDDSYLFSGKSLGADTIADSSGTDTLNFAGFGSNADIDLSDTSAHTVSSDLTLTLPSTIENVIGSSYDDAIVGNALSNLLQGGFGSDDLYAYAGSGTLDTLDGGAGNDTYYSAESGTTFRFSGLGLGTDTINDFNSGDVLDFSSFGRAVSLDLTDSSPQLMGTDLTLSLSSLTNIKTVIGSSYGDTITGNSIANSLVGGGGNDSLTGGSGNDTILGGGDDDSLTGGAGNDSLDGGSGNDSYLFSGTSLGADTIADASGIDTLNFTGFGSDVSIDLSDTSAHTVSSDLTLTLPNSIENVIGSSNNDTITGNALSNLLQGAGGNDSISAYAGSGTFDTLEGGAGNDTYYSTESGTTFRFSGLALGTDTVNDFNSGAVVDFSNFGRDISFDLTNSSPQSMGTDLTVSFFSRTNIKTVIGSNFGDTITGDSNANSLIGGGGNDTITGGNGNDTINGGDGDDLIFGGANNDSIIGGNGNDIISGDEGRISLGVFQTSLLAGTGNDSVSGGAGNDTIYGVGGLDTLLGEDGNDVLLGGDDVDFLIGGNGNDSVSGNDGDDYIFGDIINPSGISSPAGSGNDTLDGGAGNDVMAGGDGSDSITGGTGYDLIAGGHLIVNLSISSFQTTGTDSGDTIDGGDDDDTIFGGGGNDSIIAGNGNDIISGDEGGISLLGVFQTSLLGGSGGDSVYGGNGNDTIYGVGGVDSLLGEDGNDVLSGGDDVDFMIGGNGNDSVSGNDGDDYVFGDIITPSGISSPSGSGDDTLDGGAGNDFMAGGDGSDSINGGTGFDFIAGGHLVLNFLIGGFQTTGTDAGDTIDGGADEDTIFGGGGNDSITGGSGNDIISGDEGGGAPFGSGILTSLLSGSGNDTVYGGDGNDTIYGVGGNDVVNGEDGNDSILGGAGSDILIGGIGADSIYGDDGGDIIVSGAITLTGGTFVTFIDAIQAEWTSGNSYANRILNIKNGTGGSAHNGTNYLDGSSIDNDTAVDALFGEDGTADNADDWFLVDKTSNPADSTTDAVLGEDVYDIYPF